MNTDDKPKTLRWLAKETEFAFAAEELNSAADLLESQQTQLAESQRREQAAVDAIKSATDYCGIHFNPCEAICSLAQWCKWRGPQQAGKGETE